MLNIEKTTEDGRACYMLEGRLDAVTSVEFEEDLAGVLPEIKELILDFEKVDYVSSAGLRVLLAAQKQMDGKEGSLKLLNVCDTIMDIMEVTGFDNIICIENGSKEECDCPEETEEAEEKADEKEEA
ncbi:MAG: STAS domain-containing protein [Firmicutes bacterium]|nr:STAS domain-containing protein [Bacillota bacterium]